MKKALAILVFAALSSPIIGQTTSITAVVTDSNSVNWVNATCTATWIGTGKAIDLNGKSFTTKPTCAVDSSASLTVTVQDVAYIAPPASTWRFCVTPATSQAVTGCTNIAATGASESITTQITAAITPPNVTGGILAQAYADSEVQAVGGNMYYNIVTPAFRCYSTSWATCGGGGGGSGTVTSFSSGNLSPLFTSSVATATTTPALTFTLSNAAAYSLIFNNSASPAAPAYVALSSLPVAQFPTLNQSTTGNAATATNLAGGALGSAPYQSAGGASAFIASPTTSGHNFVYGWQPTGSAVAPTAVDLATVAASPLPNCSPETSSFNAAAVGCYSLTGSTASTGTVTATVSTGLLIKYFNSSSANLTVAASAGPTLTCLVTTSCIIPPGGSATIFTSDGTNLDAYIPSVGGGSVTSVSVTTANGVSGTVATSTTTPAITLTLGAITPTSTNGVSSTTMGYVDPTSSIQTQLNGKQGTITFGTGVQTALGVNVGTAGSPVVNGGALGTPSGGTLTNATGLPIAGIAAQAADTVDMNATGGSASPSAVAMPACTTGADLYNTSTHSWSCVSTGGSGGSITGFGTLVAYDVYYMPAGGSLATAKADGSINLVTNPAVCVASSTSVCATAGNTVTNGSWSWTVGGVLYVSDATTGLMTQTSPSTSGHYVQQIGIALSATVILIQPGVIVSL